MNHRSPAFETLSRVRDITVDLAAQAAADRLTLPGLAQAMAERHDILAALPEHGAATADERRIAHDVQRLDDELSAWCDAYRQTLTRVASRSNSQSASAAPSRLVSEAA